jgi:hypothetical protein
VVKISKSDGETEVSLALKLDGDLGMIGQLELPLMHPQRRDVDVILVTLVGVPATSRKTARANVIVQCAAQTPNRCDHRTPRARKDDNSRLTPHSHKGSTFTQR